MRSTNGWVARMCAKTRLTAESENEALQIPVKPIPVTGEDMVVPVKPAIAAMPALPVMPEQPVVLERTDVTQQADVPKQSEPEVAHEVAISEESSLVESAYASEKSHNKRCQCPRCPYFGAHLACHVEVKHGQDLSQKDIALIVAHSDRGEDGKTFNPNSRYQCGIDGCNMVVTRKGQHIRRHHKIVDKQAAKEAKPLQS